MIVAGSLRTMARADLAATRTRTGARHTARSTGRAAEALTLPSHGRFRGSPFLLVAAVALTALLPTDGRAEERLDHHGAVGLLIGSGLDVRQEVTATSSTELGTRVPVDIGGTYNIGHDSNELKLVLRAALLGPRPLGIVYGGYRGYFGSDAWKTFFDLDLRVDALPTVTVGPRMGLGVQYELGSLVGVYSGIAAHVGAGQGIRFGAELVVGVQLRSFLLE